MASNHSGYFGPLSRVSSRRARPFSPFRFIEHVGLVARRGAGDDFGDGEGIFQLENVFQRGEHALQRLPFGIVFDQFVLRLARIDLAEPRSDAPIQSHQPSKLPTRMCGTFGLPATT